VQPGVGEVADVVDDHRVVRATGERDRHKAGPAESAAAQSVD
jgi:hypothetical protein